MCGLEREEESLGRKKERGTEQERDTHRKSVLWRGQEMKGFEREKETEKRQR